MLNISGKKLRQFFLIGNILLFFILIHFYRAWKDTDGKCNPLLNCGVALFTDSCSRLLHSFTLGLIGGCTQHSGKCSWWNKVGRDMPSCEREHFKEMLDSTKEAFAREGVKWFLISGTLLGSIRHGDFIPWDSDVDVCVYIPKNESREKWDRAMQWMVDNKGYSRPSVGDSLRYSKTNWNHIDYFDCVESGEDGWLSHWVANRKENGVEKEKRMYEGAPGYEPGVRMIHSYSSASAVNTPRNVFFPIQKCLIDGSTYPCPNDPVRALLTDFTWSHWIQAKNYRLEKLLYPVYSECLGDCPRRNKKADVEKIKESICGLHHGEWPSLHDQLLNEFGKDVCSPYIKQKYTAWREIPGVEVKGNEGEKIATVRIRAAGIGGK